MEEVKKSFEKSEVVVEKYEISGRVLDLLKAYAKTTFLSKRKYDILKLIINNDEETSVEMISSKIKMSKPLVSYHMNGNIKSNGMIKDELVTSREIKGRTYYKVTDYGMFIFEFAKVDENFRIKGNL